MTHGYGLNHFQARYMDIKSDDGNSARKVFSRSKESSKNTPKVDRKRPRESDDKRTVFFLSQIVLLPDKRSPEFPEMTCQT